jgi:uncharacterized protein YjbI with pentapeptide repeats
MIDSSDYNKAKRLLLDAHKRFLEFEPDGLLLNLEGADLRHAVFDDVNLSRAQFRRVRLLKANFADCSLHLARFDNSRLTRIRLTDAVFSATNRQLKPDG